MVSPESAKEEVGASQDAPTRSSLSETVGSPQSDRTPATRATSFLKSAVGSSLGAIMLSRSDLDSEWCFNSTDATDAISG